MTDVAIAVIGDNDGGGLLRIHTRFAYLEGTSLALDACRCLEGKAPGGPLLILGWICRNVIEVRAARGRLYNAIPTFNSKFPMGRVLVKPQELLRSDCGLRRQIHGVMA